MRSPTSFDRGIDLLERDAELALISGALDGLSGGAGALIVVDGPAGIGKTRIISAAAAMARERGVTVLSARGTELEAAFGFGVVRQLFEPATGSRAPGDRVELFQGPPPALAACCLAQPEEEISRFPRRAPAWPSSTRCGG